MINYQNKEENKIGNIITQEKLWLAALITKHRIDGMSMSGFIKDVSLIGSENENSDEKRFSSWITRERNEKELAKQWFNLIEPDHYEDEIVKQMNAIYKLAETNKNERNEKHEQNNPVYHYYDGQADGYLEGIVRLGRFLTKEEHKKKFGLEHLDYDQLDKD